MTATTANKRLLCAAIRGRVAQYTERTATIDTTEFGINRIIRLRRGAGADYYRLTDGELMDALHWLDEILPEREAE